MKESAGEQPVAVLTIGHSTRTLAEFVSLLQAHGVARLVDVRTIPRSRHNPQFNKETLPGELRSAGIAYQHIGGLGGLRHARRDSANTAWRNASFRGYADYMQTPEFEESLQGLIGVAGRESVAIMCAEAVPWRCHRSLIADALVARGIEVQHITSAKRCQKHTLTPWAVVKGRRVTYPGSAGSEGGDAEGGRPGQARRTRKGEPDMKASFKVGDHVSWNSEAGRVRGTIKRKVTAPTSFRGYTVRASKDEPQYMIKSDKTDHLAMHKGSALRKLKKAAG